MDVRTSMATWYFINSFSLMSDWQKSLFCLWFSQLKLLWLLSLGLITVIIFFQVYAVGEYSSPMHAPNCSPELVAQYFDALEVVTYEIIGKVLLEEEGVSPKILCHLMSAMAKVSSAGKQRVQNAMTLVSSFHLDGWWRSLYSNPGWFCSCPLGARTWSHGPSFVWPRWPSSTTHSHKILWHRKRWCHVHRSISIFFKTQSMLMILI